MNGRTARGGAYGFKLSTLTKLADTKTTDNKKNLLQWIVEVLDRKESDMLLLSEDLVSASGAAGVPFQSLGSDLNQLKQGVTAMENAMKAIPETSEDRFHKSIGPAADEYTITCRDLLDGYAKCKTDFVELCAKFGEDGTKVQPEEFFGTLAEFAKQLDAAKADVLKGKEMKLKANPSRSKMLDQIKDFDSDKLKKAEFFESKKKKNIDTSADSPNILSAVGSLAQKIATDRKKRAEQEIKSKKKKPQQSGKLDKMLSDLKTLDVNSLMDM